MAFLDETGLAEVWSLIGDKYGVIFEHCWKRFDVEETVVVGTANVSVYITAGSANTIYYSDSYKLDGNGNVSLVNPSSVSIAANASGVTSCSVLKGKYVTNMPVEQQVGNVYYVPANATFSRSSSTIYTESQCSLVYVEKVYTKKDFVYSPSRNAYPDDGELNGYKYTFMGVPLDNAVTAPAIATGSYTGTGTSGSGNENSLTFDFVPKALFINVENASDSSVPNMASLFSGQTKALIIPAGSGNGSDLTVRWSGNTVSWYASQAKYQFNNSGVVHRYMAIG